MSTSVVPAADQSFSIPGQQSGVFATVRLVNEHGRNAMQHLGENYEKLSSHNRHYLVVERVEKNNHPPIFDNEYEPDPSDSSPGETWEGVYQISLDRYYQAAQGPHFGITIGRGLRTAGANRGIDLLVVYPTKHPRGVLPIHAIIRLNFHTAWPMLIGVSNDHPVRYMEDGVAKTLGANQGHALYRVNHFFVGQIECTFTLSEMALAQLELWGKARHDFLIAQGLPLPDSRLPVLPIKAPIKRVGPVMIYTDLASGGFDVLSLGVDVNTGRTVAVKSCLMKDAAIQAEIINEVEVALNFTGEVGLVQASYVSCNHGYCFGPGQYEGMRRVFSQCAYPDTIYMILPLAKHSFRSIGVSGWHLQLLVLMFWGVLRGLAAMHRSGYVHRDITHNNMLVMPGWAGKLCEFGKAEKQSTDTLTGGGPLHTQAPELDGKTPYTYGSDVWSCAFAFLHVLFPNLHTWAHYQPDGPQTREWILEAYGRLTTFGLASPLHRQVSGLLRLMLSFDPNQRPSIQDVLIHWPVLTWAQPQTPAKKAKIAGNIQQPDSEDELQILNRAKAQAGAQAAVSNI